MENISNFVNFLLDKGFTLTEDNKELHFDTYGHEGFYVQIAGDPDGKHFIALSVTNLPGWQGWHNMNPVNFFILKQHYSEDGAVYFNELSQFFMDHYNEIREAFKPSEYPKTEAVLAVLKKEYAKITFGYEEPEQQERPSWLIELLNTFSK